METEQAETPVGAGALTAAAFVAPWILLSLALPDVWRWRGLVLLGMLSFLLVLAASIAERMARERQGDPTWWAFLTVVTFGYALAILALRRRAGGAPTPTTLCGKCGRLGDAREPFCFSCGAFG